MQLPRMDSIGYILIALSAICLFQALSIMHRYHSVDEWVRTDAQPVGGSTETLGKGYHNGKMPAFQITTLNIKYEYWADQNKYFGQAKFNYDGRSKNLYSFVIYYNPLNPAVSTQTKRIPWSLIGMWVVAALACCGALYGWLAFKSRFEKP